MQDSASTGGFLVTFWELDAAMTEGDSKYEVDITQLMLAASPTTVESPTVLKQQLCQATMRTQGGSSPSGKFAPFTKAPCCSLLKLEEGFRLGPGFS